MNSRKKQIMQTFLITLVFFGINAPDNIHKEPQEAFALDQQKAEQAIEQAEFCKQYEALRLTVMYIQMPPTPLIRKETKQIIEQLKQAVTKGNINDTKQFLIQLFLHLEQAQKIDTLEIVEILQEPNVLTKFSENMISLI